LSRFIFRVESASGTTHVHETSGHKRNCDDKAKQEIDKNWERGRIEKDICDSREREDNERRATASEHDFALPMSSQSFANSTL
jgi:hypothetical protein